MVPKVRKGGDDIYCRNSFLIFFMQAIVQLPVNCGSRNLIHILEKNQLIAIPMVYLPEPARKNQFLPSQSA